ILLGLGLLYFAGQRLFVSHELAHNNSMLHLSDKLWGTITLRSTSISGVEIDQIFVRAEEDYSNENSGKSYNSFSLLAMMKNGEEEELISGLRDYKAGFLLEYQIEQALNIEDRLVRGELLPLYDLLPKIFAAGQRARQVFRVLSWLGD
ncbi:MAG: hypothetical protein AAF840_12640, partial [Bacteroidota bacterium]